MKFFHLSDLHIGKHLHSYSLREEQEDILGQIVQKAGQYRPDAVLICGDIYDKTVPSGEAYEVFDCFLTRLSELGIPILIIGGNHDSPERLSYAASFLERHRIYIAAAPPFNEGERLKKVTLADEHGEVDFYMLPFTKPSYIRHLFGEGEVTDYESGIRLLLAREEVDYGRRNVLLSHQFYQASDWLLETCDSEQVILSVGGTDKVDVSCLQQFDYAALGHLHGPQRVKFAHIRYSGTPLKYSVSEEYHKKSITLVTLGKKGEGVQIDTIDLVPLRDVRTVKGTLAEICARYAGKKCEDYVRVILTDEGEPVSPKEKLSMVFERLLDYRVDNRRTRGMLAEKSSAFDSLTPMEAFCAFYEEIHKIPMSKEQKELMEQLAGEAGEEEQ